MARAAVFMAMAMVALVLALAPAAVAMEFSREDLASEEASNALYKRWSARYNVTRAASEAARRFPIFLENARRALNALNVGINGFADMTDKEIAEAYKCAVPPPEVSQSSCITPSAVDASSLPGAVDWTEMGYDNRPPAVTSVKDQGSNCGSCWAFAAAASVEGLHSIKEKTLVSLSAQQLIDCDTKSKGCNGGWGQSALDSAARYSGIAPESAYPYKAQQGSCQRIVGPLIPVGGYADAPQYSELELRAAVARQPVVVTIYATAEDLRRYPGGFVFSGKCQSDDPDEHDDLHQLVVVGYGTTEAGEAFWLLKNSWGTIWGESGFMMMTRDVGGGGDGIYKWAFYPKLN